MPTLINNLCDDYENNLEPSIESILIKKKMTDIIAIFANRDVEPQEECGFFYGHTCLCDASLPLAVLSKAAQYYYYTHIIKDDS